MSESESIKANIAFHEKMFFTAIAPIMILIWWIASSKLNERPEEYEKLRIGVRI